MAAKLENLSGKLEPTELKKTSKIEDAGAISQEKSNKILTIELARYLNHAFLSEIPDETPLLDLKMTRRKLKDPSKYEGLHQWALTIKGLPEKQKQQLNTTFLIVERKGFKNVGLVRKVVPLDMPSKPGFLKKRIMFLKEAFAPKKTISNALKI